MHVYKTGSELYDVLEKLFTQLQNDPELIHDFAHSNLVVRINLTNPSVEVLLDGRQPPIGIYYGSSPGSANFEISLEADLLHKIWLGQASLIAMLFSGEIQTTGNIMRAQPAISLLQGCGNIYQNLGES